MQSYFSKQLYELVRQDELISGLIKNSALESFNYCDINNPEDSILNDSFWSILGFEQDYASEDDIIDSTADFKNKLDHFFQCINGIKRSHDQLVRYSHRNGTTVLIRSYGLDLAGESDKKVSEESLHFEISVFNAHDATIQHALKSAQQNYCLFNDNYLFELFDKIGKGLILYTAQGGGGVFTIKEANRAAFSFFNVEKEIMKGKSLSHLFPIRQNQQLFETLNKVLLSDKEISDVRISCKVRNDLSWRNSTFIKLNKHDILEVFDDISSKVNEEEHFKARSSELAAKEKDINLKNAFYTNLLDSFASGVVVVNAEGIVTYCNNQASAILEIKLNEVTGQKITDCPIDFINEDFSKIPHQSLPFNLSFKTGKDLSNTVIGLFNPKTHQKKWVILDVRLISDAESQGKLAVLTMTDITFRKKIESEILKNKEDAEEKDRLKSLFLANMSHEIRTPMNGILGFTELLKDAEVNSDDFKEYISIIEKSGVRLLNIINDIIDISKIESGQMHLVFSDTNVNEQLDFIHSFFKPEAESKGMDLMLTKGLTDRDSIISTDSEKLYAVFTNLVKNAIKYGKTGQIDIGYKIKNGQLEFFVKDRGPGIPKDNQNAVFNRFERANLKVNKAVQGAGLGLSISKAYVEMLGGKIWFESKEGEGTTFFFTHPYNVVEPPESKTQSNADTRRKALKVLVAEEDETAYLLIEIALRSINHSIIRAKNGLEAVECCIENPDIDLILMDIKMPEMDGHEATKNIRQFNKDVVIIAQTAYGLIGDREKALEAGCNDYISKPVKQSALIELIKKFFNTVSNEIRRN